MGKIGKNAKTGEIWHPVTPKPHVIGKTDTMRETSWPLHYNMEWAIFLQCVPWAVGWSEYLWHPSILKFFLVGEWPLNGKFAKIPSIHISRGHGFTCREVDKRSCYFVNKKTGCARLVSAPHFAPTWGRSHPEFLNVVALDMCTSAKILSGLVRACQSCYSQKIALGPPH